MQKFNFKIKEKEKEDYSVNRFYERFNYAVFHSEVAPLKWFAEMQLHIFEMREMRG